MELYLKNKSLSPEEYGKFEQNLIAGSNKFDTNEKNPLQSFEFTRPGAIDARGARKKAKAQLMAISA